MRRRSGAGGQPLAVSTPANGFIAREDGSLDWLTGSASSEDYGFGEFFDTVDAMVLGRATYETVLAFDEWPYGDRAVRILTRSPDSLTVPLELHGRVKPTTGPPAAVLDRLDRAGCSHAYIDGGKTIQSFLSAGLIDEMTLSRAPILIGSGIPLFGPVPTDIRLEHVETRTFGSGFVQSRYRVLRE